MAQAEKAALEDQSKLLLRRFADLEAAAADLQSTNHGLLQQVRWLFGALARHDAVCTAFASCRALRCSSRRSYCCIMTG
jgi:hypothetical protein